jgi:hypothetical protein
VSDVPGTLTAERVGPDVRFTFTAPDGFDHHSFVVEQLVTNPAGEEEWVQLHTGVRKFISLDEGWDRAPRPRSDNPDEPDPEPAPLPGPRTYRALAYRDTTAQMGSNVRHLTTGGAYSDAVTVD